MAFITEAIKQELALLYNAPGRHYHDMSHVNYLLQLLEQHHDKFADPDLVEAVIWFHDCIYDTQRSDNELQSAELAVARLKPLCVTEPDMERLYLVRDMIEATAQHVLPQSAKFQAAARSDLAMFLDMDLSILGSNETRFDQYETAVRKEYDWVDEDAWRTGRAAVLTKFQSRPHIFFTDLFRDEYECKARSNIARSLRTLQS